MQEKITKVMNTQENSGFSISSEKGFDVFYMDLFPPLCTYVNGFLKDMEQSKDIVQEAFVTLWENRNNFKSYPEAKAYLYKICTNSPIDSLRKRKKMSAEEVDVVDNSFEEQLMANELSHLLLKFIETLPPETRKVLLLTLDGKSYKEVAEELKISVNTVRNQRIRAVKHLRKNLSEYMPLVILISKLLDYIPTTDT
jgi:RNA polymerase sigma-70 factor (ECF subfamily)